MAYTFTKISSQYLLINNTPILQITGAITIACWAKRGTDLTSQQHLVAKYESSVAKPNQRGYILAISTSGTLISRFSRDGTVAGGVTGRDSSGVISTSWSHLATTWIPNQYPNIYINGILDNGIVSGPSTNTAIHNSTANLTIGANSATDNSFYGGDIAEVGIWKVALSADEIASLGDGVTNSLVRPQSLVFYAPLIRDLVDTHGGLSITNNNIATVSNHPRIYY
jgi:hypothetical protein